MLGLAPTCLKDKTSQAEMRRSIENVEEEVEYNEYTDNEVIRCYPYDETHPKQIVLRTVVATTSSQANRSCTM